MAKYYGKIGYVYTEEDPVDSGIWVEKEIERYYYGDVISHSRRWVSGEGLNDDLTLNVSISILADSFALNHVANMRYVEWENSLWKIDSITPNYPRLELSLGGVYHGS